jgi:hypothetical protein
MQTLNVPLNSNPAGSEAASRLDLEKASFLELLDHLLRHREQFFEGIFTGDHVGKWSRWFLLILVLLTAIYGLTMGTLGFTRSVTQGVLQSLTSGLKVPLLYLVSLGVSFPVLYIVLVLMGARLRFTQTLALILMALALNSVLLASCAPIVLFFILTGSDYHFIKLLHVGVFTFSGCWAMMALWRGLQTMCEKSNLYPRQANNILKIWILVFGFVGTQMAWSLRPFVGSPALDYQLFRAGQAGNFYQAVWSSVGNLGQGSAGVTPPPRNAPSPRPE